MLLKPCPLYNRAALVPPDRARPRSQFPSPEPPRSGPLLSIPSTPFDRSQCDCNYHEDQKDGSRRTRSTQCSNATPNAIAIHCAIIFASMFASSGCEMTEGITPLRR
jgi:hypothetical protein